MSKPADTALELHPLLLERWSPRAFDRGAELSDEQVQRLLEAARWAPSANNGQPWRFLVARRGDEDFERLASVLNPGNRVWASNAAALVLVAAATVDDDGGPRATAAYDTGLAVAQLTLQAGHEGLAVHQMGGFDKAAAAAEFALPAGVEPVVVLAVGVPGDWRALPEHLAFRERSPRVRKPLSELLLNDPSTRRLAA
jgi:nitroreductase